MLRKPKKPGSRAGREWTEAQQMAFRVFSLRGLWSLCGRLSPGRMAEVQAIIDEELLMLGAEPEWSRRARRLFEMERERRQRIMDEELPF